MQQHTFCQLQLSSSPNAIAGSMKLRLRLLQSVLSLFHSQSHALSTRDRVGPTQVGQISISAQRDTSKLASVEVWVSAAPGSRLQEQIAHWNRCISTATITTEVVKFPILRHCDCLHPLRARPCKSWTKSRRFVVFSWVYLFDARGKLSQARRYRAQLRESGNSSKIGLVVVRARRSSLAESLVVSSDAEAQRRSSRR